MEAVYFVNGFLEAGKTSFIIDLINKESFRISGKTLILLCEEGEREYNRKELEALNTFVEVIENEEDFNEEIISSIEKKYRPERVIVEFNGMWDRKKLKFPWYWDDPTEVSVFDATTFKLYSDNMRSLVAEQVRNAALVVFYKADEVRDKLASYARNINAINASAAFVFRGKDGDIILDPEENLPYDINCDELDLSDTDFAVLSMDSLARPEAYEGKKVHFKACVYKMLDGGDLEFIAGRQIMTCCAADMSFTGIICGYPKAYELENREWVEINGIMRTQYDEEMKRDISVCRVTELQKAEEPDIDYVTLI